MKRESIYLPILLFILFFGMRPEVIGAASVYDKVLKHDPGCPNANSEKSEVAVAQDNGNDKTVAELEAAALKEDQEDIQIFEKQTRLLYEKMLKRTKECRDALDNEFFTLSSHARKATETKDYRSEKEFINVLSDYNSVLGDLGLMQIILDLGKSLEGEKFLEYYYIMESGFERLKDNFSLKNEVFLSRIDKLKNPFALNYAKKLLREYKIYFQYDPRIDKSFEQEIAKQEEKNRKK